MKTKELIKKLRHEKYKKYKKVYISLKGYDDKELTVPITEVKTKGINGHKIILKAEEPLSLAPQSNLLKELCLLEQKYTKETEAKKEEVIERIKKEKLTDSQLNQIEEIINVLK